MALGPASYQLNLTGSEKVSRGQEGVDNTGGVLEQSLSSFLSCDLDAIDFNDFAFGNEQTAVDNSLMSDFCASLPRATSGAQYGPSHYVLLN